MSDRKYLIYRITPSVQYWAGDRWDSFSGNGKHFTSKEIRKEVRKLIRQAKKHGGNPKNIHSARFP